MQIRFAILAVSLCAFVVTSSGCAAKQKPTTNWLLREQVLIPPQPPTGSQVILTRARSSHKSSSTCNIAIPQIRLHWSGRTAQVNISPDATGGPYTATVVSATTNERLVGAPVRDLNWWSGFQELLQRKEAEGCLGPGDAERLSSRIIEHLELSPGLAYQLRYGNSGATGYLDLEPQFALKWMTPQLKPGVTRYTGPKDVAGYETMTYRLKPRSSGGLKLELESVEHNVYGALRYDKHSTAKPLTLPDSARYLRYFFRTWRARDDRRIALLGVKRRDLLDPLTKRFEADPEKFCDAVPKSEAVCLAVPNESILVPEVEVRANGKPTWVPVGGTVADALGRAKVKMDSDTLQHLTVLRPWSGMLLPVEFDRSRQDILRLVMIGGETIQW